MPAKDLQDKRIDHIYKLVESAQYTLDKVRALLDTLDREGDKNKYREIPGVTGIFDGSYLVTPEGQKLEVPTNYSAKSRLVFGDTLKMVEEEGKQLFKQIEKVKRKKIEGILTKKEGKWYILADAGTYKVSDIAADFYGASLNDEAAAYIPEDNLNTPFATLDKVKTKTSVEMDATPMYPADSVAKPAPAGVVRPAVAPHATTSTLQSIQPTQSTTHVVAPAPKREVTRRSPTSSSRVGSIVDNRPDIRTEEQKAAASKPRAPRSSASGSSVPRPRAQAPADRPAEAPRPASKEYVADIRAQAPSTNQTTPTAPITNLGDDDLR